MSLLKAAVISFLFCAVSLASNVSALETTPHTPPPELTTSPIIVTGYSRTGSHLDYVQIYNNSDMPVDLDGWSVGYSVSADSAPLLKVELHDWIAPMNYLVVADKTNVSNADFSYELSHGMSMGTYEVRFVPPAGSGLEDNVVTLITAPNGESDNSTGAFWRDKLTNTGKFLTTKTRPFSGGGFYYPPETTLLQVSEVYANSSDCSLLSTSVLCNDYIKLYNPSNQEIDLSDFRLRTGYYGQNSTSSNTYLLTGKVSPGHYAVILKSADNRSLSVTNGGGYIWLEDTFGVKRYDSTVTKYTDASADSKKGLAWAYDPDSGTWKWTTRPMPEDAPSVFVDVAAKQKITSTTDLVPCKPGQYRSKETNRCRSIAAVASLAACPAGQTRNPETNRCRKTAVLGSQLTPCKEGQARDPTTNRCRKVTAAVPEAAFAVEPVQEAKTAFAGWWTLGGVGALAVGYGAWEWRQEAISLICKIGTFFTSGK